MRVSFCRVVDLTLLTRSLSYLINTLCIKEELQCLTGLRSDRALLR